VEQVDGGSVQDFSAEPFSARQARCGFFERELESANLPMWHTSFDAFSNSMAGLQAAAVKQFAVLAGDSDMRNTWASVDRFGAHDRIVGVMLLKVPAVSMDETLQMRTPQHRVLRKMSHGRFSQGVQHIIMRVHSVFCV
jgi:hypothetical protein